MPELFYNVVTNYQDINNFEELELDIDSLYLVLVEKELEDCIRPGKKKVGVMAVKRV